MSKLLGLLAILSVFFTLAYGWVMNIINLINGTYAEMSTIIIGAIGVFMAPVGAIVHFVAG